MMKSKSSHGGGRRKTLPRTRGISWGTRKIAKEPHPRSIDVAKEPSEFWSHDADLNFSFSLKPRKVRPQQISSPRNYSTKRNCRVHDFRGVSLIEGHGIRKICGCGCCSLNPKGLFEALAAKVSHLDVAQCVLGERSLNECSCRTIKPESHKSPPTPCNRFWRAEYTITSTSDC